MFKYMKYYRKHEWLNYYHYGSLKDVKKMRSIEIVVIRNTKIAEKFI